MSVPTLSELNVKLFADGATIEQAKELSKKDYIQGFTTNPTLARSIGVQNYAEFGQAIVEAVGGKHISFEVLAEEPDEIKRQARLIASWAENAYVKVPVVDSKGNDMSALVGELSAQGVKINITAVFSVEQVERICKAIDGKAPAVVSVFAGRIADSGRDPVPYMQRSLEICRAASQKVELLWASPRELFNIIQAHETGVDIITATPGVLKKLANLGKDLEQFSRETVEMFVNDAKQAGFTL